MRAYHILISLVLFCVFINLGSARTRIKINGSTRCRIYWNKFLRYGKMYKKEANKKASYVKCMDDKTTKGCYFSGKSAAYEQPWTTTRSNKTCIAWNTKGLTYISDHYTDYNYCRDPDETGEPWCFYGMGKRNDLSIEWETCGIPTCSAVPDKDCEKQFPLPDKERFSVIVERYRKYKEKVFVKTTCIRNATLRKKLYEQFPV